MGRRIKLAGLETLADPVREPWFEIVGVVADVTNHGLQAPVEPEVWVPYTVTGSGEQVLLVRSQQTPMALGAERADVLRLVIRAGLRLVTAGVAIGLIVSLLLGRAIEGVLWRGVKPYDPATLAGMTLLLVATGALACWIPARRAARVDPMVALRYE